jgi:hypothetical protein
VRNDVEMIAATLSMDVATFEERTGWHHRPEGWCSGDVCVPGSATSVTDGVVNIEAAAKQLRMPLVHDSSAKVWAVGPSSGGAALTSAQLPGLQLTDFDGNAFDFNGVLGRKVIMVAWASW